MIRIAYCDDSDFQRELLKDLLEAYQQKCDTETVIYPFASGQELLSSVKENGPYDIYVLDIQMPEITGYDIAVKLRHDQDSGIIIFLTATPEFAVASYDVQAFFYLLKPADAIKFNAIMDKAINELEKERACFTVKTVSGPISVDYANLMYARLDNRSIIYTLQDSTELRSTTIRVSFKNAIASLLTDERFAMCNVSTLVNLSCIDALDSDSLLLKDGTLLYPSRSAYGALSKAWSNYKHS